VGAYSYWAVNRSFTVWRNEYLCIHSTTYIANTVLFKQSNISPLRDGQFW